MEEKFEKNELFQASHLMILISYTFFSAILIGESILLSWENWALIIITLGVVMSWGLHIQQRVSSYQRLWIYSILMMGTFFFYGIHKTSMYDAAAVMTAIIILYTMTGIKSLIMLCQVTYYVTFGYDLIRLFYAGEEMDSLVITRTLLHLSLIFMIGWIARIIIDKWRQVLGRSREEIEMLSEATTKMNDFLANMSHEIRTPVNAVLGLTNVCIEKEKDPEIKSNLNAVTAAGKRITEQISDILDYSEIDMHKLAVNLSDYMLSSVLNDLVNEISPYKPSELELVIDVDPALPSVMKTDVSKLKKILWHLIMNGLKYTKEGGVYVRISSVDQSYGLNLLIEVTDTGIGMDEEEQERIFDRFYQADSGRTRAANGLGLGMAIVSGFTKALGGFLTLESAPNAGTTVRVSIPQQVVDPCECMSVENRDELSLGSYLHFEKFANPEVREFYNSMLKNIVKGLKVSMHRVDNLDSLKKLLPNVRLTHLFVAQEEYLSDVEYMESLAKEMLVVVVANEGFRLPEKSGARILRKPFYCFPVVNVLNMTIHTKISAKEHMICPDVRALVVDDEPMNLTVAKGIFKRYEMKIVTAASGGEAIELCKNTHFDIVFMDHMMPGMDGIEAMKRIRADKGADMRDVPIVALTANAVSTAREMFIKEGFDGFVSKPVELIELERVMKRVLPGAKVVMVQDDEQPEEQKSTESLLMSIGVDTELGMHYCQNDKELYTSLLAQFISDSGVKRQNLEKYYRESNFPDYAITIHALKSTAKMIGATKLSESARALEDAAKNRDEEFIRSHHAGTMEEYQKLTAQMRSVMGDVNEPENGSEDVDQTEEEIFEFMPEGD